MKLSLLEPDEEHDALFSLPGEKFQNKVKLDWPPPIQANKGLVIPKITIWNVTTNEFKVLPRVSGIRVHTNGVCHFSLRYHCLAFAALCVWFGTSVLVSGYEGGGTANQFMPME
ncbi:hypothetical protein MTR_0129s0110 [Medicago truncatula]|uniref:Uncharacterized protein n=1 Tax=Medicago truncatula TaxID=3880 RepID=G8A0H5_MEDTR|nr:hypothetical protein MTR_0129s0110 [Medicago truncatula]